MILNWLWGKKLTPKTKKFIDRETDLFISAASVYEIQFKANLGKLKIPTDFYEILRNDKFIELPLSCDQAFIASNLPTIHRDPFDRMLIAQAMDKKATLVTSDQIFNAYNIKVMTA